MPPERADTQKDGLIEGLAKLPTLLWGRDRRERLSMDTSLPGRFYPSS